MTHRTLIALAAITATTAFAQTDSFVGKWKMNIEKSQFAGLSYKIVDAGNGTYSLLFGDRAPETVTADGSEHKTQYGDTWSLKSTGTNTWKFTQKRDGQVTSESTWKVSDDGQTLTFDSEVKRPDGSTSHNKRTMKRAEGSGTGLAGTWEIAKQEVGSPDTMTVASWEGNGYSITYPVSKDKLNLKMDGKDYPHEGPRVPKGQTVSGKENSKTDMELTYKLSGKTLETDHWQLSGDGKTLTQTISYPGETKQEVDVFDRE